MGISDCAAGDMGLTSGRSPAVGRGRRIERRAVGRQAGVATGGQHLALERAAAGDETGMPVTGRIWAGMLLVGRS